MDFFNAMKKFVEKPKNNKAQKQRVATSIFDIFFKENFEFDNNRMILRSDFLNICRKSSDFRGTKRRSQFVQWLEERGVIYGFQAADGKYYVRGIKSVE
jgi:hypothetical protein